MYLKKQGIRVVIRGDQRYSNWTRYEEIYSGGRQVITHLCPLKGECSTEELGCKSSVRLHSDNNIYLCIQLPYINYK